MLIQFFWGKSFLNGGYKFILSMNKPQIQVDFKSSNTWTIQFLYNHLTQFICYTTSSFKNNALRAKIINFDLLFKNFVERFCYFIFQLIPVHCNLLIAEE